MDPDRAAAHQLGSEMAALMGPAASEAIRLILADDRLRRSLAGDPGRAGRVDGWP
jgi:hypothetical protein